MRSLKESIMDVDTNIDELEIPEKPKVSKSDYPYYEQAWYDILNNMLDFAYLGFRMVQKVSDADTGFKFQVSGGFRGVQTLTLVSSVRRKE